jgi:hypothetical protein
MKILLYGSLLIHRIYLAEVLFIIYKAPNNNFNKNSIFNFNKIYYHTNNIIKIKDLIVCLYWIGSETTEPILIKFGI